MKFKSIEFKEKNKIELIRKKYRHSLSSHAFSSLYLWHDNMKLKVFVEDEFFCVKNDCEDHNYFFPCGDPVNKRKFIARLLEEGAVSFQYIREEDKSFLERNFPGRFEFCCAREDWEYIYNKEEQIRLDGGSYKHLRSKIHRGQSLHHWTVLKLSQENIKAAEEVTRQWNNENTHGGESADIKATLNALENFERLNLSGVLLKDGDKPLAFAMGTPITKDTYDLHISKTIESDIDCYLKWELYKQLPEDIQYINREEDMGIEGLRIHKTDMKPVRFNELWKGWTKPE